MPTQTQSAAMRPKARSVIQGCSMVRGIVPVVLILATGVAVAQEARTSPFPFRDALAAWQMPDAASST